MADLREIRALAAAVYPSLAAHGHSVDSCVEQSLIVAEKLVARSQQRADQAIDVAAEVVSGPTSGGRPLMPQRSVLATGP